MARIPDSELERIKREVSLERLAIARGMKLEKRGDGFVTRCFLGTHKDTEPSLVITPSENLWHCFGCDAGGSVIDFVMRLDGVSFTHAVQLLREGLPSLTAASDRAPPVAAVKRSTVRKLPRLVAADAADQIVLCQVVDYYHQTLKESPEALAYLQSRGLESAELVERFQLGYANRSLGYRLPAKNRAEGATLRGRLTQLGIYRTSGHEHLAGSLTVPIGDAAGRVVQLYGRKIRDDLRKGTPDHLYLPAPLRGVWNREALQASPEIILCEALLDAMSFWVAGFTNVTTAYGVNHVPPELWEDFKSFGTRRVLIAFDRDDAGERAAAELAPKLQAAGLEVFRIQFPKGMDANAYLRRMKPAAQAFDLVVRHAVWLGQGKAPTITTRVAEAGAAVAPSLAPAPAPAPPITPAPSSAPEPQAKPEEAVKGKKGEVRTEGARAAEAGIAPSTPVPPPAPAAAGIAPPVPTVTRPAGPVAPSPTAAAPEPRIPSPASPAPAVRVPTAHPPATPTAPAPASVSRAPAAASTLTLEREDEGLWTRRGDRTYRIRDLEKNTSDAGLRIRLRVSRDREGIPGSGGVHLDQVDLSVDRQRLAFIKRAAEELELTEETVKHDVGQLVLALELARDQAIRRRVASEPKPVEMSEAARAEALELLRDLKLLDRILADFVRCGVVGEETNKLVGYLAAVSRKLTHPLAVVIQSSSAAGKSSLMDAVLAFMPEEERVVYSAMTGQALFYMSETQLAHKILAIAEEEGAQRASYSLKLLQSEGRLKIASTGKDPLTGKQVTHIYEVEGPVMLFLTTTALDDDEELMNRCLLLTVDEGRAQTRAIHRLQRERKTLEGLLEDQERGEITARHQNAQRLLRPLKVVNPFAKKLTFLDHQTRTRRDHMKYLTLIEAITLLHQYQREVKTARTRSGAEITYIEVTEADLAIADRLAQEVLPLTLDEMSPRTRQLLAEIAALTDAHAKAQGRAPEDFHFTRRQLRAWTGLGHTQLKTHLHRLVELEYLRTFPGSAGESWTYQLVDPAALEGETSPSPETRSAAPAGSRGQAYDDPPVGAKGGSVGGWSGGGRALVGGWSAPPSAAESGIPSGKEPIPSADPPKTHNKGNGAANPGRSPGVVTAPAAYPGKANGG